MTTIGMSPEIRVKLLNAVTEHDRRESKKKGYNIYALAMYCGAIQSTAVDMDCGATLRQALLVNFNDRLLDRVLVAVGEEKFTREERFARRTWSVPEDDE